MDPEKVIEALIFVSDVPVKPMMIAEVFGPEEFEDLDMDVTRAEEILDKLIEKFKSPEYPYELKKINQGYQLFTKKDYFPYLRRAILHKNQKKLSRASMETLSIIAYRQPATKTEVEFIRGVSCDYAVQKLLEKNLIEITGRSDAPGRPLLYRCSSYFMEYFGINDISELPKLQEFNINEEEYQEQFKVYLEENDELTEIAQSAINEGEGAEEEPQTNESPKEVNGSDADDIEEEEE